MQPMERAGATGARGWRRSRSMRYADLGAWFVLFSALDIMLTHRILNDFAHVGGREVNTIADWVIGKFGLWGAILLKTLSVLTVLVVAEAVGRRDPRAGRRLMQWIVFLSILPPGWALVQLAWFAMTE
jgi:hypothetical protein